MRTPVIACVGLVIASVSGASMAADLAPRPVGKAPFYPAAPLFTWTGFYIGGNGGYGWGSGSGTVVFTTVAPIGATGPVTGSGDGFFGGVQAGYNWQFGSFVLGAETDFQ